MELLITDISSLCCPEEVEIGTEDTERTERIRAAVMADLGGTEKSRTKKPRHKHRNLRIILLASAVAALLSTAAFAVSKYMMKSEKTNEPAVGHWAETDGKGVVRQDRKIVFKDAGMVFTFSGPEEQHNLPQFRANWLPDGKPEGNSDSEGWTGYLCDNGDSKDSLPYLINAWCVDTDNCKYVLNGDVTVLSDECKDGWQIMKIVCDYSGMDMSWDKANYILMFNPEKGWLVEIGGTSDMEILEKIANNLEIREGDMPQAKSRISGDIGMIDIGRG